MLKDYKLEYLVGQTIETKSQREFSIELNGEEGYQAINLNPVNLDMKPILFSKLYPEGHENAGQEIEISCSII